MENKTNKNMDIFDLNEINFSNENNLKIKIEHAKIRIFKLREGLNLIKKNNELREIYESKLKEESDKALFLINKLKEYRNNYGRLQG